MQHRSVTDPTHVDSSTRGINRANSRQSLIFRVQELERRENRRIVAERERIHRAFVDQDELEGAWEILRDAIGIPDDTSHGRYLADMVAEVLAEQSAKIRALESELKRVRS